ncbi:interferon-induced very large GTPase 1-like [Conger conger]|uniref:interferon-induced very large GTPase 1-like n=1 Tax=Conger conger TaxID=82655 RepID=UPI002A59CA31|nr:interferon-induced very large GTPase 1-like [Conger conger]
MDGTLSKDIAHVQEEETEDSSSVSVSEDETMSKGGELLQSWKRRASNIFRGAGQRIGSLTTSITGKLSMISIGKSSKPGTSLEELLRDLGLEHHLKNKLTLSQVLQIDGETLSDESIQSLKSLPWCFLRKLMMVNESFRRMSCSSQQDTEPQNLDSLLNIMKNPQDHSNRVNPLDLITAVFLCSDGFLQQEMALKMSMCQFSVPLLLPTCDTQQCTLMLWAMRDIVKKYKPRSLEDPRGFVEESIVLSDLPMVSFVRLGNCSMSKSHILNQVLSNPQQYQDTFVHKDMECGDTPRRISNGLVEISWYLPSGNKNTDIFSEPLAIANLRGDLRDFETQYAFLCRTSTAIFVFCDDFKLEHKFLDSQHFKTPWFLIINSQSQTFNEDDFKKFVSETKPSNIIIKHWGRNDAEFNKNLRLAIQGILEGNIKMSIERMSALAYELGIHVDENYIHCKRGKQKADEITGGISDIPSFKEKELPLQGTAWKQLANLEKEQCRMKNAGEKNIEVYKIELADQRQKLREQQRAHSISDSMSRFISTMCNSTEECKYFLKWMGINLDNLSRTHLPPLRAKYKEQSSLENKELIAQLDREISSSSLGTEHFLREMAQLYESACSLPEALSPEMKRLPLLCAKLLQEGFPLELVDGDTSNIPLEWVTQVLKELHDLTQDKCKIRVITVLGIQSTGKSTLLNTMFGVQFAVSSGRCTRGAFMLLIRVKEDFKVRLGCDYIMIIDTEGLKAPQLAQLDDSYEHDNELATLVVGLSDITVINIAMENSMDMNDILQIVVHAFLRMKEVGRKPCCQFVHQNVPDISAHDSNMRDRKLLLEQLNEMTQAAAKMEKKGNNKTFTDVMEYDPERNTWYIPGLWHGNPPMAPVNVGYSESANLLKRSVIEKFMEQKSGNSSAHTIINFLEWTKSLWQAVKYENFIFSFRNSLVAEAYAQLCTEFNQWDWAFRKNMYSWLMEAETKVSNSEFKNLDELLICLKTQALAELTKGESLILSNLTEFYKRQEGHVHLVVKYKEDLNITAKTIRRETEKSVRNKLEAAVEIRKGMFRLESIKKNHTATMEKKVQELIEKCRKTKDLSDEQLEDEFEKMWKETELRFPGMEERDIVQDISHQLWVNLEMKGSSVREILSKLGNLSGYGSKPFKVKSEHLALNQRILNFDLELKEFQQVVDHIIKQSKQFVNEKVRTKSDYHKTYTIDLLCIGDKILDKNLETTAEFQAKLKIHICGHAAREFQKMHLAFIHANDPLHCLEQFKQQYYTDFKDLFNKRDQCQKKANDFIVNCLQPAVKEYITKSLGPDLVDDMLTGQKAIAFSTRTFFQFSILEQLLKGDNFQDIMRYINNYETFVHDWILKLMVKQFSEGDRLRNIEMNRLKVMVSRIKEAIKTSQMKAAEQAARRGEEAQNIQQFIQDICSDLAKELVIPKDPLRAVLALNSAKPEEFSHILQVLVDEMEKSFTAEFQKGGDVRVRLTSLPFQPQKELFNRVFGCGKRCPFCKTPCEAGGKSHTVHVASIHRPQGIGGWRYRESRILLSNICCTDVASERSFYLTPTGEELHPYKDYRSIFPDWLIQPDTSIQASDYWKYIFSKFNKQFAEEYKAKHADIPPQWRYITQEQATQSLKESFSIKTGKD